MVYAVDWETTAAVGLLLVTAAGVIVTSFLNIRSNRLTRKRLKQDRVIAESTAERSEAAARLTEEYASRIVDALEQIAAGGLSGGVAAAAPRGVRWELVHHDGDQYRLTNVGDEVALGVKVETHETLYASHFEGGPNLGPGEALTFLAAVTFGTRDSTVTVKWHQEGDEQEYTWRYPLPSRPSRRR